MKIKTLKLKSYTPKIQYGSWISNKFEICNLKFAICNPKSDLISDSKHKYFHHKLFLFCFTAIFLICLLTSNTQAALDFTLNKFGVRALGMGGAYTALAEGPEAIFYNCAKKPALDKLYITIENGARMGTPYYTFSAQNILDISELRFGYIHFSDNGIPETQMSIISHPELTGNYFSYGLHSLYLGVRTELLGFDLGVLGNYFQETLKDENGKYTGFTFSAYRSLTSDKDINVGFTAKNLINSDVSWSTGHKDNVSPTYIGGVNLKLFNRKLNICLDLEHENNKGIKHFGGIEYWVSGKRKEISSFVIRSGIRNQDITVGLGLYMNGILFDYALTQAQKDYLETEHRFSLSWSLFDFVVTETEEKPSVNISDILKKTKDLNERYSKKIKPKIEIKAKPALKTLLNFKLTPDNKLAINLEEASIGSLIKLNQTEQLTTKDSKIKDKITELPISTRIYSADKQEACTIAVEKTKSGHLTFSGFLSSEYYLMINSTILHSNTTGKFYHKVLNKFLSSNQKVEVLLFKKETIKN